MKDFVNRSYSPDLIFFQESHFKKDQTDFCIRKLTLNIKNCNFQELCTKYRWQISKKYLTSTHQGPKPKYYFQLKVQSRTPQVKTCQMYPWFSNSSLVKVGCVGPIETTTFEKVLVLIPLEIWVLIS